MDPALCSNFFFTLRSSPLNRSSLFPEDSDLGLTIAPNGDELKLNVLGEAKLNELDACMPPPNNPDSLD